MAVLLPSDRYTNSEPSSASCGFAYGYAFVCSAAGAWLTGSSAIRRNGVCGAAFQVRVPLCRQLRSSTVQVSRTSTSRSPNPCASLYMAIARSTLAAVSGAWACSFQYFSILSQLANVHEWLYRYDENS